MGICASSQSGIREDINLYDSQCKSIVRGEISNKSKVASLQKIVGSGLVANGISISTNEKEGNTSNDKNLLEINDSGSSQSSYLKETIAWDSKEENRNLELKEKKHPKFIPQSNNLNSNPQKIPQIDSQRFRGGRRIKFDQIKVNFNFSTTEKKKILKNGQKNEVLLDSKYEEKAYFDNGLDPIQNSFLSSSCSSMFENDLHFLEEADPNMLKDMKQTHLNCKDPSIRCIKVNLENFVMQESSGIIKLVPLLFPSIHESKLFSRRVKNVRRYLNPHPNRKQ